MKNILGFDPLFSGQGLDCGAISGDYSQPLNALNVFGVGVPVFVIRSLLPAGETGRREPTRFVPTDERIWSLSRHPQISPGDLGSSLHARLTAGNSLL
jgi:hypothetical protein